MTGLHCIFCGYELPDVQVNKYRDWDMTKIKCPNCGEEILIEARKNLTTITKIIIKM